MTKEKTEQNNKSTLIKVSVHINNVEEEIEQAIEAVKQLTKETDFYLIVNTTEPSTKLTEELEKLVDSRKVFRCKTFEGELALIRQLGSRIHVETDLNVIRSLKAYLNHVVTTQNVVEA